MKLNLKGGLRVGILISPMTEGRFMLLSFARLRKAEQILDKLACESEEKVWQSIRDMADARLCEIGLEKMTEGVG